MMPLFCQGRGKGFELGGKVLVDKEDVHARVHHEGGARDAGFVVAIGGLGEMG